MLARPDVKTFQVLPWHTADVPVASVFCDIFNLDGSPFEGCPRHALRRMLDKARAKASLSSRLPRWSTSISPTPTRPHPPITIDSGSYFELTATDKATDLRKQSVLTLEEMGIPVEHAQHEDAPSQHEIDLRYTDALTMADTVMTVRLVVKETAHERRARQLHAETALRGPGLRHAHPPLAVRGRDERLLRPRRSLPRLGRRQAFIAGLLRHARRSPPSPTSG